MTDSKPEILDEPVDNFGFDEVFMSRTDERGVIQSGNDVFARVSGFDWAALQGAPHKVVRHPDMPKAAFGLMWDTLQSGDPFCAYVKNLCLDGRYYWVFAVVVPVEGGYLSVRLNPGTDLLKKVAEIYADVQAEQASLEDLGRALLVQKIQALGFRDYADFTAHALQEEFVTRAQAMGNRIDPSLDQFARMNQILGKLLDEAKPIQGLFKSIDKSAANLSIFGAQLGDEGAALQVLAKNYGSYALEIDEALGKLAATLADLLVVSQEARLSNCASLLYAEALPEFRPADDSMDQDFLAAEHARLESALSAFVAQAHGHSAQIHRATRDFQSVLKLLRRQLSGLALTRTMCRIQSAMISSDTASIDGVSDGLQEFQVNLGAALNRLESGCRALARCIPSDTSRVESLVA